MIKNLPANVGGTGRVGSVPGFGRSPGEGNGNPVSPEFLPRESHGQRSLASYSPWGREESDMKEHLSSSCKTDMLIVRK